MAYFTADESGALECIPGSDLGLRRLILGVSCGVLVDVLFLRLCFAKGESWPEELPKRDSGLVCAEPTELIDIFVEMLSHASNIDVGVMSFATNDQYCDMMLAKPSNSRKSKFSRAGRGSIYYVQHRTFVTVQRRAKMSQINAADRWTP